MKPTPFSYRDPRSLDEALALLAEHRDDAVVLAGGQSLVPLLNLRLATPRMVVDINRVAGLDDIVVRNGDVRLGALARASTVERHDQVAVAVPVLRQALALVGHPQIRNRTTIGGSVAHADPAAELPTVLAALDGYVVLTSVDGAHNLPWQEFFQGFLSTARRPDELVTAVGFPIPAGSLLFTEVARCEGDFALVGACVGLSRDERTVTEARVALCGAAGTPLRVPAAEALVVGQQIDAATLSAVHDIVVEAADPVDDVHAPADYRRHVAATLVARSLDTLWTEGAL